jgi:hypothetical protein
MAFDDLQSQIKRDPIAITFTVLAAVRVLFLRSFLLSLFRLWFWTESGLYVCLSVFCVCDA